MSSIALKSLLFIVIWAILNVSCTENQAIDPKDIQTKITWLHDRLFKKYWKKDQQYLFPVLWEHRKGLFESKIHFNFVDKKNSDKTALIRDDIFKIDDNNMFVTSFVLYGLL